MSRTLWRFLDRNHLPSEHIEAKVMEFLRKGVLTKRQTINGQGQELVTTELNFEHPLVQKTLPDGVSRFWTPHDGLDDEEDGEFVREPVDGPLDGVVSNDTGDWDARPDGSRYHRRFTTTNGGWRGKSNVRSGTGSE